MTEKVTLAVPAGGSVVEQRGIRLPNGRHIWETEPGEGRVELPRALQVAVQPHVWLPDCPGYTAASPASYDKWIAAWRASLAGLGIDTEPNVDYEPIIVRRRLALIVGRTAWPNEETRDPIEKPNAVIGLVTSTSSTHGGIDVDLPDGPILDALRARPEKSPVLVTMIDAAYPVAPLLVTHAPSDEASAAVVSEVTHLRRDNVSLQKHHDGILDERVVLSGAVATAIEILDGPDPKVRNRVREVLSAAVEEVERLGREYRGEPDPIAGLA